MGRFSFHRGSLALDFAGTVGRRASAPEERIPDRAALAAWLREAGLVAAGTPVSDADLTDARALREAIAHAGEAIADDATPERADIERINAAAASLPPLRLDPATGRGMRAVSAPLTVALARIAADAIETFAERRDDLVRCALPECGALLLSASTGRRRRWCAMETCGNVAKARAHRARQGRAGASA